MSVVRPLLETDAGIVVIDHKSSPRPRSEWAADALEHSGQLDAYRRALEAAGLPVAECWIHFPISGGMLRLADADSIPEPGNTGPTNTVRAGSRTANIRPDQPDLFGF